MGEKMSSDIKYSKYDASIQTFTKSQLAIIEQKVEQLKMEREARQEIGTKLHERVLPMFKKIGFDADQLKELNEEFRKLSEEVIANIQQELSGTEPPLDEILQEKNNTLKHHQQSGWSQVYPISINVLATEHPISEKPKVKIGNPSVYLEPYNSWDSGLLTNFGTFGSCNPQYDDPNGMMIWQGFQEERYDGTYEIVAVLPYNGVYCLWNLPIFVGCLPFSRVALDVELGVGSYYTDDEGKKHTTAFYEQKPERVFERQMGWCGFDYNTFHTRAFLSRTYDFKKYEYGRLWDGMHIFVLVRPKTRCSGVCSSAAVHFKYIGCPDVFYA
jgi:hypothetical protein